MNIEHKQGFDITQSTEDFYDQGVLSVYTPLACPERCPWCPSWDRVIYDRNPLGVQRAHIEWFIDHLGKSAETVLLTGADPLEAYAQEQIIRYSRRISCTQRFCIETCCHSTILKHLVQELYSNVTCIRVRLLGSIEWYNNNLFNRLQQNEGDYEKPVKMMIADRLMVLYKNVEAITRNANEVQHHGLTYEFLTYLRPDMTLDELNAMADQFKVRNNKQWVLEPYIDCTDPKEPVLYKVDNIADVLAITGATFRENRYSNYATSTQTITLKGDIVCATTVPVTNRSNSTVTTGPCPSSNEEASSPEASMSDAANTQ